MCGMHPFPHLYQASTHSEPDGPTTVSSPSLPAIQSSPPPEFGGPGGQWSPETLLCAALADCFVLSFRAVATASKFDWNGIDCTVKGTLAKAEGGARFTHFVTNVRLQVPPGADAVRAKALLEKAEKVCLISASVSGSRELVTEIAEAS